MAQPMPPQYPGPMYYAQPMENMLTRRNLFLANGLGLLALWIAGLIAAFSGDLNALNLARFLAISGAMIGAGASVAGAIQSKQTTDLQNVGLFVWAGLLLGFAATLMLFIGRP